MGGSSLKHQQGEFRQWKGAAWLPLDDTEFIKHIANEYAGLPVCRRHTDIAQIVKLMAGLLARPSNTAGPNGINFANGFLTDDMRLRPHSPEFGCTYVLPYRYQTDGRCPLFLQMLDDCWGGDADYGEKVMALQEAFAVTLMGIAPRYQRAFCLIGRAHSGKSRILEILKGLLPEGCHSAVPPTDWGDKFMPAQMVGKLVNFAGEISERREIAGEIFKQVIEGAEIEAQQKNKPIFRFRPKAAQWFASNHVPKTRDTSDGFNRRWLFLEFPRRIPDEKKVIDIDQVILAAEREQIVAWALEALPRLAQKREYTLPSSHHAMVDEMANQNNSVRFFLRENPLIRVGRQLHKAKSNDATESAALFDAYWVFCATAGGVRRVSRPDFVRHMRELAPTFGFEEVLRAENGTNVVEYKYISLVGPRY